MSVGNLLFEEDCVASERGSGMSQLLPRPPPPSSVPEEIRCVSCRQLNHQELSQLHLMRKLGLDTCKTVIPFISMTIGACEHVH